VAISSTLYAHVFHTNVVLAAFSSYVLALLKNLYKKCARKMVMKSTGERKIWAGSATNSRKTETERVDANSKKSAKNFFFIFYENSQNYI